jgi:hypothetical protein
MFVAGDDWHPPNHQQTLDRLELLANDALRFRAKRDRRVQRSSFRQIQAAIKVLILFFGNCYRFHTKLKIFVFYVN